MPTIFVDDLVVQLPSETLNTFNPVFAFGGRSLGGTVGLRDIQTGNVLLPCDADGNIVVAPGRKYSVIVLTERRQQQQQQLLGAKRNPTSASVVVEAAAAASSASPAAGLSKRELKELRRQQNAAKASEQQQQQPDQQVAKKDNRKRPHEDDSTAKPSEKPVSAAAAVPIPVAVPAAEAPKAKKSRVQSQPQPQLLTAGPASEDDEPLSMVFSNMVTAAAATPADSPAAKPRKERGSPKHELVRASSENEPLSSLYGDMLPAAAATRPLVAPKDEAERKKRGRKPKTVESTPMTGVESVQSTPSTGGSHVIAGSPTRSPASAPAKPHRSASPMEPASTMPPSARQSTVRRPPMDTSSESD